MNSKLVLDVSNNAPISAAALRRSGAVALIAKATEGSSFKDGTLASHRWAANHVRIPFGSYLFLHPGSPGNEANVYLDVAKPWRGDIEPVIDAEVTDGQSMAKVAARVDSCARALEAKGYRPILYASTSFWQGLYAERPGLRRLRVWEAQYPGRFTRWFPHLARLRIRLYHRTTVVMWQWTSSYPVGSRTYDASRLLTRLDKLRIR